MNEKNINIVYTGKDFGEFIKSIRIYLGYTQEEFSNILSKKYNGFSYSSIRDYEQGKREPKYELDVIDGICVVFEDELKIKGITISIKLGEII